MYSNSNKEIEYVVFRKTFQVAISSLTCYFSIRVSCILYPDPRTSYPPMPDPKETKAISSKARQARLFDEGTCTSCGKRPRNKESGSTLRLCPICADRARVCNRNAYRKRQGISCDAPIDERGRPRRFEEPES
jgi:hypothetical protein